MTSFQIIKMVLVTIMLQIELQTFAEAGVTRSATTGPAKRPTRGCPLSPYATYLTREQQETLHELVVEARNQGADELMVKSYVDKYVSKVLPPEREENSDKGLRSYRSVFWEW
ncbi:hypothetical protein GCK32_011229 [Trichostrongylus colubriformis]|uniref:Uncharacterized protein n=1 Tax=Trichostrongylus colubriformis TaxID=6319 RepID=A0AAN8IMB6_TRICO